MDSTFEEFEIQREDMERLLYWCFLKFKLDPDSRMSVSKRRKIGQYIDDWSNTIPNWLIFNRLLKDDDVKILEDYFIYTDKGNKKATDVLGLKNTTTGRVQPFLYFDDGWQQETGMPQIEVKTFRKDQELVTFDQSQYDDELYYCFVQSDFHEHYLLNFFQESVYSHHKAMKMSSSFVRKDTEGAIICPPELEKPAGIGTLRLLGIYKGSDAIKYMKKFSPEEVPYRVDCIKPPEKEPASTQKECPEKPTPLGLYQHTERHVPLPVGTSELTSIRNPDLENDGKSLNHVLLSIDKPTYIDGKKLEEGNWRVEFKPMERRSNKTEYMGYVSVFDVKNHSKLQNPPDDRTEELINQFRVIGKF